MSCRDIRTSKTLAVVVAIDKSDDVAKAGFLGEPDFTPSDRYVYMAPIANLYYTHQRDVRMRFSTIQESSPAETNVVLQSWFC